jgi:hypothetical protein
MFHQKLDANTGERQWEPYPNMATDPNYSDLKYLYTEGGGVFDWELFNGFIAMSSTCYADGKVYVGSHTAGMFCRDAVTGRKLSWYEADSWWDSSPAVAYGYLYGTCDDWNLYCWEDGGPDRVPTVHRTGTSITANPSATTVAVDTPITISGKVIPEAGKTLQPDGIRGGPSVRVVITRPDGTKFRQTTSCKHNAYGWYEGSQDWEVTYIPDMAGTYTVETECISAQWEYYHPSEAPRITFTVTAASPTSPPPAKEASLFDYRYAITTAIAAIAVITLAFYRKK